MIDDEYLEDNKDLLERELMKKSLGRATPAYEKWA